MGDGGSNKYWWLLFFTPEQMNDTSNNVRNCTGVLMLDSDCATPGEGAGISQESN